MSAMTSRIDNPADSDAETFVETFRAIWAAPRVEDLDALMHPNVRYTQPLLPDVVGSQRAGRYWRRMFTIVPDLHLDVINSAVCADHSVYVEFVIKGTLGRRPLSLPAVDGYVLDDDGRVVHRTLYCDSLMMARTVLHPTAVIGLVQAGVRLAIAAAKTTIRSTRKRGRR
jgi:hypothetical protein